MICLLCSTQDPPQNAVAKDDSTHEKLEHKSETCKHSTAKAKDQKQAMLAKLIDALQEMESSPSTGKYKDFWVLPPGIEPHTGSPKVSRSSGLGCGPDRCFDLLKYRYCWSRTCLSSASLWLKACASGWAFKSYLKVHRTCSSLLWKVCTWTWFAKVVLWIPRWPATSHGTYKNWTHCHSIPLHLYQDASVICLVKADHNEDSQLC